MTDAADEVIGWFPTFLHGQDFDGISLVVRTENELTAGSFHVLNGAGFVLEDSIHIVLTLAVGLERVVVAIDEKHGTGQKTGIHAHTFAAIGFNEHEPFPASTVAFDFGLELLEKTFLEFQDLLDMHAGEEGMAGGDGAIDDDDVLKFIIAGREDGSALVDFRGVEQIEHREMLDGQDTIHAFKAETALAVQKIGDVSLLEAGLLGQAKSGEIAFLDAFPESIAKIFLQDTELHGWEYSTV